MQKMQNFSGEGAQPPPPQWGGAHPLPTPYPPRRLDLNPPHSEILPTLLPLTPSPLEPPLRKDSATHRPVSFSVRQKRREKSW